MPSVPREPIAIVGIGCRFPGADGPRAYWQLLCDGVDAIGEIPPSRFDLNRYYDPTPATPGRIITRWGGFLADAEKFDAEFFGVSPREAERLDPQQRWLLETSWDALEDAGASPSSVAGTRTGVFVGMWINEYESRLFRDPRALDFYMTIGSGRYAASGRLSYVLGLQGPSITIDSGCSASLAAVHLACQSLWSGESEMALAAGVNAILEPNITIAYSQSRMMAPDGRCKFGDARANGYVRSEGAGVVVLKRLDAAIAAGDRVYATILGSSLNNDGRSSGFLTTPGSGGQQAMLRQAYEDAGVAPAAVSYVEAHGTGTRAGDPVELEALGVVLGEGRHDDDACRVGSVKTNIGHTEGAAGLAGLIKVALSLHHRFLPKSLHFQEPNPDIPWASLRLRVQSQHEDWPDAGGPPVAGVSSFGIAGTNAHVVLQGVPQSRREDRRHDDRPYVVALSAASEPALTARLQQLRSVAADEAVALVDLCWTTNVRRDVLDCRAAVVARTRPELVALFDAALAGESRPGLARGRKPHQRSGKVVFVFPGQGSQWLGMGRQLIDREPAFREAIAACDAAVKRETGWSVADQLAADESSSRLREIDVVQPVLFSIEVALAALWRSWGIEPAAVVGHSMGEVAAAHVAGVLTLDQAAQIICRRSRLLLRTSGKGAMALVDLTMAEAHEALQGREDLLSVAVSNSTRSTVISGDPTALEALLDELQGRDVFCRRVKVDVASHSPQMDPLRADLLQALDRLAPRDGAIAICSTVSGAPCDGHAMTADYWVRNLRAPVLFSTAIARLLQSGHDTFIEMSPHPILVPAIMEGIGEQSVAGGIAVGSTRRDEDEQTALMSSLAALFAAGHRVPFDRISMPGRLADLPPYPWQRERHWFEAPSQLDLVTGARAGSEATARHPIVPSAIRSADRPGVLHWHFQLDAVGIRQACGDVVAGVVPAALYVELLLACAAALGAPDRIDVREFAIDIPQRLPSEASSVDMQVATELIAPSTHAWRIFSRSAGDWTAHARAIIEVASDDREQEIVPVAGPVSSEIALPADRQHEIEIYRAHPAIVDAGVRALATALQRADHRVASVARIRVRGSLTSNVIADVGGDDGNASVVLRDRTGEPVIGLQGVAFAAPGTATRAGGGVADWSYTLAWHPVAADSPVSSPTGHVGWTLVANGDSRAALLADALRVRGDRVVIVHDDAALADSLGTTKAPAARVVHFAGHSDGSLASRSTALTVSALRTAQRAISREASGDAPRLWFVTTGAQQVDGRAPVNCAHAPIWGLARAIAEEHPSLWGGIVDLDATTADADAVSDVLRGILRADGEDQIAFRGGEAFALRLVRNAVADDAFAVRPNRTYVIAGGLGNLGLQVARWLTDRGAQRLVLIGRHGLPQASPAASADQRARVAQIRALEEAGALVHVAAVDIAEAARVDALFAELEQMKWPPIAAVFQCAGVTEGNLLAEIRDEAFERVWRSKVPGTCVLLDATKAMPLDAFVMFSSMASFLPSPGQASYAAANAFLDAAAADGRSGGRRTLAINWGPWAGIGMAAELEKRGALGVAARGFENLAIDQALTALGKVAGGSHSQIAVMAFDWRKWRAGAALPLMSHLAATDRSSAVKDDAPINLREQLAAAADDAQRRTILETVLQGQLATVLKRPQSRIELNAPVRPMGLDSLMALEFRNRLEALTGLRLPATLAWNHPTVVAMAAFIGDKLQVFAANDAAVVETPPDEIERLLAEIEQMPDADARRLALEGQ